MTAGDSLRLAVDWAGKRTVEVEVNFERPLADIAEAETARVGPSLVGMDPGDLESKAALLDFLREATRTSADGETVRVLCWAPNRGQLYAALGYEPGDSQPVPVKVSDG